MRNLMFLAALAASTAAVAQTTTADPNAAGNMDQTATQQPTDTDPQAATDPAMSGTTQTGTMDQGTMNQGSMDQQPMAQPGGTMGQQQPMASQPSGGMAQQMPMGAGQSVAPGNQAPERDARGIAVVSDPAMAPPGTNMMQPGATQMAGGQGSAFQTTASTKDYPICSRTVTDGCVQAYERGARRR